MYLAMRVESRSLSPGPIPFVVLHRKDVTVTNWSKMLRKCFKSSTKSEYFFLQGRTVPATPTTSHAADHKILTQKSPPNKFSREDPLIGQQTTYQSLVIINIHYCIVED